MVDARRAVTGAGSGAAGLALAVVFGVVGVVRRDRPLHAYGQTWDAVVDIDQPAEVGVPLLDVAGRLPAVVRTSRAASLTHRGPDVAGIAVRLRVQGQAVDLLFASTGTSRVGRYLLAVRRDPMTGPLTTLFPVLTSTGPLQLALFPQGYRWDLAWSRPGEARWSRVGRLVLGPRRADVGHFDPVGNLAPGMAVPRWVRALRSPSYRLAQLVVRVPRR